ncbi:MAG: hypothetical protein NUV90_02840 [Candidatus Parcubacteria bacterium]|nr:hypothetical protein [Candidatus Parcubacteria bacterium]
MIERVLCILSLPKEFLEIWVAEKNKEHENTLVNRALRFSHVPPLHSFIEMPYRLPGELMKHSVPGIAGDCLPFEVKQICYVFHERDKVADFIRLELEIEPVSVSNIVKLDKEQIAKGLPTNVPIFFDFLKRTGWE